MVFYRFCKEPKDQWGPFNKLMYMPLLYIVFSNRIYSLYTYMYRIHLQDKRKKTIELGGQEESILNIYKTRSYSMLQWK